MRSGTWPQTLELLDRSAELGETDPLYPFALEEVLCRQVGEGRTPLIHLWRHPRAVILGLRDRRLPQALGGIDLLKEQGYAVAVRNSGGAAVPLDDGVVNLSLILPNPERAMDFRLDFDKMVDLIRGSLPGYASRIRTGEISGAYCPGDFDLSMDGRKFCGIAQRRQTKAYVIQAFIVAEGLGTERAALVRSYYDKAASGADNTTGYPTVETETMASLSELTGTLTADRFIAGVRTFLSSLGGVSAFDAAKLPETEILRTVGMLRTRYDRT